MNLKRPKVVRLARSAAASAAVWFAKLAAWPGSALLVIGSALLAVGGPSRAAQAAEFAVPFMVEEPAGVARQAAPISGGLPLPAGRFAKDQPFAVFRLAGAPSAQRPGGDQAPGPAAPTSARELPCQVLPLVVETDGTLRWVLVDFQDDVAAGATNHYELRAVRSAQAPRQALSIQESPTAVTINTGRLQLTVAKDKPFGLFDAVAVDGRPVLTGGRASYTQLSGRSGWDDDGPWQTRTFVAGPPQQVAVRYAGPLRVTLEISGRFAGDPAEAGYQAWITAWAGRTDVWVKYKLCNSNPDQYTLIPVARSAIELPLASAAQRTILGAKEPLAIEGGAGWLHQGLRLFDHYQDVPGAVRAGRSNEVLWTGGGREDRPGGWIAAVLGSGEVFVCDRLFASNPARRLAVEDGRLVLEGIAQRFDGPPDRKFQRAEPIGQPWQSAAFWLYDCTHHSSEYYFDFALPGDLAAREVPAAGSVPAAALLPAAGLSPAAGSVPAAALFPAARGARNRLWLRAAGEYYSACEVLGVGRFATLEEEKQAYRAWGWTWQPDQEPKPPAASDDQFVAWEDNHYESEADSVQGLLLMYLRTGGRGWFDLAEAWARYHMDLQAWRTDGWRWKDGGIWFPTGGPQGNRPVRAPWNFAWGPDWAQRQGNPDCADLWRHAQAKSCYCHFYGSGLADYYCLTGEPDALAAALDNVEQKDDEFRHFRQFKPGESATGEIRGFGRGFEVMMRVLMAQPENDYVRELCHLCARTLWQSPLLDERGFHCSQIGGGQGGMALKNLSPEVRRWMDEQGITFTTQGDTIDTLSQGGKTWKVHAMGGTWQHVYIQNGADLYARYFDDEDMRDFTIAFAQLSARYMLSPKCHQTWYYTYFDVPARGMVYDPWVFEHTATTDGEGCQHSGWYTRFYPDACAKGYSLTGEAHLLERGRQFWYYGSKRDYQTLHLKGGPGEVGHFAGHVPPKDDTVLEVSRLLYEASHPRADQQPPEPITDLQVRLLEAGQAEVSFTAPADRGGGRVIRYQVKADRLPIAPYEQWDFVRDSGQRRNWWRAANCRGEPVPGKPGARERFVVSGVPSGRPIYFAVRSFDQTNNRSPMSNLAVAQ